jgi:hypothetical protein
MKVKVKKLTILNLSEFTTIDATIETWTLSVEDAHLILKILVIMLPTYSITSILSNKIETLTSY